MVKVLVVLQVNNVSKGWVVTMIVSCYDGIEE